MGERSQTPGMIARKRKSGPDRLYWSADKVSRKAKGYPERLIPLPKDATEAEIIDLCETYTARLKLWIDRGPAPRWLYDGTVGSLCDAFERHPQSPIREVRRNTAESYIDSFKVIRLTVAKRAVRALTPIDAKGWYDKWRAPGHEGGPARVKRAHDAIAALRMILNFGLALGYKECGELGEGLSKMRFERSAPRESAMTLEHARAFIAAALEFRLGEGIGRSMAIGVATQFETMLRQKDVVGEWTADAAGREMWIGPYTWERIPGGIFRLKTSKTGAEIAHDLTKLDLLWPLIQAVPQADRAGALVKAYGEPIRTRTYRKWFREIAQAAKIPDSVWNMDARAGAVTEALEAGAEEKTVQRTATHASPAMTRRYDRTAETAPRAVAEARRKARTSGQ
jgi:Phage integrase family